MALEGAVKPIVFHSVKDMPGITMSLGDTRFNLTGTWRRLRPVYGERQAPCVAGCPNGNDVRRMLRLVGEGRVHDALAAFRETTPLPGVCGRVCYHPCEVACNRGEFDEALSVQAIERFIADNGRVPVLEKPSPSGFSVAVIGAGPAGLSCAYHLARAGHAVALFEAQARLGGVLRYGIPSYRLPRDVLDREIELLLSAGRIDVRTGQRFGRDFGAEDLTRFDAVFVAVGAQRSRRLGIEGEDLPGVISGLTLLRTVAEDKRLVVGKQVVVIGAGNTAVDSARVARRLGAEVTVVYRRTREEMPAIASEVTASEEEGVKWRFQAAPLRISAEGSRARGAVFAPTHPGEVEEDGRRRFETGGAEFELRADTIVMAIGEDVEREIVPGEVSAGGARVAKSGPLWLAGGDFGGGNRRVVDAMGDGRRAALAIDHRLRETPAGDSSAGETVRFADLNREYFRARPRVAQVEAPAEERRQDFREVVEGLPFAQVVREAARCFSCGSCTQCDNCWLFCPDMCVERHGSDYSIDLAYCKGCGICATECPRAVISMVEETGA